MESQQQGSNRQDRDGTKTCCTVHHQPFREHQQRIIHARSHLMGITEVKKNKFKLTLFFKVVHNMIDMPADKYLIPSTTRTRYELSKKFTQFSPSTDSFKYSFFPRTVPLWNSLPAAIAEAPFLVSFQKGISTLSF